jgi:toxin ParE1/3/4
MAYRVRIMPRAKRDLSRIYDWIGARDSDAAFAWYCGLSDALRTLRNAPNRCPVTPETADLRHLLYGSKPNVYRVIYRVSERQTQVDILHIRHGAQGPFARGDLE